MENLRKETCSSTAKQSNRRMRSAKSQNSRAKTGETEVVLPTWEFTYPEHGEVKSAQAQQVQLVSRVERNEGESRWAVRPRNRHQTRDSRGTEYATLEALVDDLSRRSDARSAAMQRRLGGVGAGQRRGTVRPSSALGLTGRASEAAPGAGGGRSWQPPDAQARSASEEGIGVRGRQHEAQRLRIEHEEEVLMREERMRILSALQERADNMFNRISGMAVGTLPTEEAGLLGLLTMKRTTIEVPNRKEEQCAICLDTMTSSESVRMLACGHRFHGPCIRKWLSGKIVCLCPLCKQPSKMLSESAQ
eukprot:CAMPEP_0177580140 /NCGR_PEP_ID=MMETSP0419_2-20121207/1383_1 /TAXON_ID=582737 /ORGANISM="Tetraselmis sp., Strain GSL018" /LENGTH=304 /DNA_ID=CAMNT_0019068951 /DNA_START=567 /DNA_END=1481 /DNA_ORIENTATION=+